MDDHRPFEYSEITPLLFIGTNACCSKHFERMLIDRGIRADISLETERIDAPFGAEFYLWLPTVDHTAPSMEKLELGVATLRIFDRRGIPCYLHCQNGHGRAPTLTAAFLVAEKGMTVAAATALIKEKRPSVHFEAVQVEMLEAYAKGIAVA